MDDDIRDRFRSSKRSGPVPNSYGRQPQPLAPRVAAQPKSTVASSPQPLPIRPPAAKQNIRQARPQQTVPPPLSSKPPQPQKQRKNKRKKSKKLLFFLILLMLFAGLGGGFALYKKYVEKPVLSQNQAGQEPAATQPEQPKPTGTIRFIASGGNLASESINNAAKKPEGGYDYLPMMSDFKSFFDKSDIRLCNQTTPGGGDKNGLAISGYPLLNAPIEWSTGFASLGCNLINLASDHINDKGQAAIGGTLSTWDNQKSILAVAGASRSADEQAKIRYLTVKQVKFAYLAYTTSSINPPTNAHDVNIYSDELANKQIAEARKNAQLVIVSMNWGKEGSVDITADQDRIATNLANQNADVIVGVGPHVLQPAKILNGKDGHQTLAWFSLGNFLNSELPVDNLIGGVAVMDFDVATQKLQNPKLMPVYMHYEWTAAQKAAGTVNARSNFKLLPLDLAAPLLAKSQTGTTVEAQTARVTGILTKFAPIKVIKSTDF